MKEWLIAGWIHLVVGFAIGWLVFKRPELVETFWQWFKHKVLRR